MSQKPSKKKLSTVQEQLQKSSVPIVQKQEKAMTQERNSNGNAQGVKANTQPKQNNGIRSPATRMSESTMRQSEYKRLMENLKQLTERESVQTPSSLPRMSRLTFSNPKLLENMKKTYGKLIQQSERLGIKMDIDRLKKDRQVLQKIDRETIEQGSNSLFNELWKSIKEMENKLGKKQQKGKPKTPGGYLGYGGFGVVYRGKDKQKEAIKVDRDFLIQVLHADGMEELKTPLSKEDLQQFYKYNEQQNGHKKGDIAHEFDIYQQAKKSQVLKHSFLQLRGLGKKGKVLIMELLEEPEWIVFSEYLQKHADELTDKEILKTKTKILCNLVVAVLKLHETGIVHLDIKPENVFANPSTGEVRLFDFGSSALFKKDNKKHWNLVGEPIRYDGTTIYLEDQNQFKPKDMDRMSGDDLFDWFKKRDIYALGVTIFFALFNFYPKNIPSIPTPDSVQKSASTEEEDYVRELFKKKTEDIRKVEKLLNQISMEVCEPVFNYKSMLYKQKANRKITWSLYESIIDILQKQDSIWKEIKYALSLKKTPKKRLQDLLHSLSKKVLQIQKKSPEFYKPTIAQLLSEYPNNYPTIAQLLREDPNLPEEMKKKVEQVSKIKRNIVATVSKVKRKS